MGTPICGPGQLLVLGLLGTGAVLAPASSKLPAARPYTHPAPTLQHSLSPTGSAQQCRQRGRWTRNWRSRTPRCSGLRTTWICSTTPTTRRRGKSASRPSWDRASQLGSLPWSVLGHCCAGAPPGCPPASLPQPPSQPPPTTSTSSRRSTLSSSAGPARPWKRCVAIIGQQPVRLSRLDSCMHPCTRARSPCPYPAVRGLGHVLRRFSF